MKERTAGLSEAVQNLEVTQFAFEHCVDGISWTTEAGDLLRVNESICRRLGYSRAELESMSVQDIVPDFGPEDWAGRWRRLKETGSARTEMELRTRTGEIVPVEAVDTLVELAGRELIFSITRDTSRRKRGEEALRRAYERLKLTESALDRCSDLVFLLDAQAGILWANERACRTLGYTQQEFESMSLQDIDPEFRAEIWAELGRELASGGTRIGEGLVRAKDGTTIEVEVGATLVKFGGEQRIFGIVRDVSERKRTEEELRRALEAAEAGTRAKSAFLANMSHELRTPLNAVIGLGQLLKRNRDVPISAHEGLDSIVTSGEHLLSLINSVLDLSKIEADEMAVAAGNFDLFEALDAVWRMTAPRAEAGGLTIALKRQSGLPRYINTDAGKFKQVLLNLVSNAIKFTEEGQISVRVDHRNGRLFVEVDDTGVGMAPEEIPDAFEAFKQTEAGRGALEGTGLGLAISRRFVRLLGGDLTAESKVGEGTTFRFDIPAPAVGSIEPPGVERQVVGLAAGQPRYRILVVDDNRVNRGLLAALLRTTGFDVKEAGDGEAAIPIFQRWRPHLIWMDQRMPRMEGDEATRRIRALPGGDKVAIIALSASILAEDEVKLKTAGVDLFVRKPYRESEIFEAMATLFGIRYAYAKSDAPQLRQEPAQLVADDFVGTPVNWIEAVREAVTLGDIDALERLAREVAGEHPDLARKLSHSAHTYALDGIIAATRDIAPGAGTHPVHRDDPPGGGGEES